MKVNKSKRVVSNIWIKQVRPEQLKKPGRALPISIANKTSGASARSCTGIISYAKDPPGYHELKIFKEMYPAGQLPQENSGTDH